MKLSADVVVTGGAGAIGSRLVKRILQEPQVERIVVIDNLSNGYRWLLPDDPRVEFHEADVAAFDPEEIAAPWPIGATVVHLAAHFANARSWDEPYTDTETNVLGTVNMLEAAAAIDSPLFVFASAGCAVGHTASPYQVSKSAGEAYCRCYYHKVPSAVFRFMNSYGPSELPGEYRNVIPRMIWRAMNGESLQIFGDGSDCRDFVYVDDLVEQIVNAEASAVPQEIGTGILTPISVLARLIREIGGVDVPIERGQPRRRWDHAGRAAVVDRRPRVGLEEGLRRTWAWFRENEDKIRESLR